MTELLLAYIVIGGWVGLFCTVQHAKCYVSQDCLNKTFLGWFLYMTIWAIAAFLWPLTFTKYMRKWPSYRDSGWLMNRGRFLLLLR